MTQMSTLAATVAAKRGCPEFAAVWASAAAEARALAIAARFAGMRNAGALERRAAKCEALASELASAADA
jgi:hypothetical protein